MDSVSSGTCLPWNQWDQNAALMKTRFNMKIEDAWSTLMQQSIDELLPAGRYYMTLSVTGSHSNGNDAQLPVIKYCFRAKPQ